MTRLSALSGLRDALRLARDHLRFRTYAQSARVQELWPIFKEGGDVTPQRWALRVWHRLYSRSSDACLERSLQLAALLRRQGRDAEIVIGFRHTPDGGLAGHAWVESEGVPRDAAGHVAVLRLKAPSEGGIAGLFASGI
jgi:hypothetical protein